MMTVGLRELRQNASDLVRHAEAGETVTVTVSDRPAAQLGPVSSARRWRRLSEVKHLFRDDANTDWDADRELIDQAMHDPFER